MEPVPFYRPRNPRTTPLWKLAETHYERLRGEWEEHFEARFGFWRGLAGEAVARYLDCGIPEMGFARLRCDTCRRERLLTANSHSGNPWKVSASIGSPRDRDDLRRMAASIHVALVLDARE